jgi:hypothetical protein
MRKPDVVVQEVVCSETGKPMTKIPLWMAGMKVKFVSDEARQKHPAPLGIPEIDPIRKGVAGEDEDFKAFEVVDLGAEVVKGFEEIDAEVEEVEDEEVEAE